MENMAIKRKCIKIIGIFSFDKSSIIDNLKNKYNWSIVPVLNKSAGIYSPYSFSTIKPFSSFIPTFVYLPFEIFAILLDKFSVNSVQ